MKKTAILFDLDGTLVNTKEGVTNCVRYALENYGITEQDQQKLERFIGPPLVDSFQREYGFSKEQAAEARRKYQERYQDIGIFESVLYPDVEKTLKSLKERGYRLAVASSKPEEFCKRLLEHLGIAGYFELIGGASMDGRIIRKADVLEDVIARLKVTERKELVLIGDTRFDAQGAAQAGVDCIGVTYGFEQEPEKMAEDGVLGLYDTLYEILEEL